MRILFFGSDDFAAEHLKELINSQHEILGLVTQPDKPKGRGMKIAFSPTKTCAKEAGISVFQPTQLINADFVKTIKDLNADLFVVVAYGRFLPNELLSMPKYGAINVHSSLLPKYRGAAPINWALINGDKETGITIIKINSRVDAGDILAQEKVNITDQDTSLTIRKKLADIGLNLLLKTMKMYEKGKIQGQSQDEKQATMAPKLTKELGQIKWDEEAVKIHNLVRGLLPWPGAYTQFKGKQLKILESAIVHQSPSSYNLGEVIDIRKDGFVVAAGKGALLIKMVHLEAGKPMKAYDFIQGHKINTGYTFK